MALTEYGFQRRSYDDIVNDKIKLAKELFGEDIETSELTPLGKFIRINAYDQALAEEEIEGVYLAISPDSAFGQSLDRLLVFAAMTRNPASGACYSVEVTGAAGYTVPVGFLVGTDTDLTYYNTADTEIGEDGTCTITVVCTQAGIIGNVSASAINKTVNPDAKITSVEGQECLTPGEEEESDTDLRKRFKAAVQGSGSCNADAIRAAILRIPTVQYAEVIENVTDEADSDGRPPHSFQAYVLGGTERKQEIGNAIWKKKPVGIKPVGDVSVSVIDASGNTQTVLFSYAEQVQIMVKVSAKVLSTFKGDGISEIQQNVTNYINGLGIGNSLILSAIYGYIYSVTGVKEVTSLTISTDGGESYSATNITMSPYQVAVCSGVTVEVVSNG